VGNNSSTVSSPRVLPATADRTWSCLTRPPTQHIGMQSSILEYESAFRNTKTHFKIESNVISERRPGSKNKYIWGGHLRANTNNQRLIQRRTIKIRDQSTCLIYLRESAPPPPPPHPPRRCFNLVLVLFLLRINFDFFGAQGALNNYFVFWAWTPDSKLTVPISALYSQNAALYSLMHCSSSFF
jgi:hypothetical protein